MHEAVTRTMASVGVSRVGSGTSESRMSYGAWIVVAFTQDSIRGGPDAMQMRPWRHATAPTHPGRRGPAGRAGMARRPVRGQPHHHRHGGAVLARGAGGPGAGPDTGGARAAVRRRAVHRRADPH